MRQNNLSVILIPFIALSSFLEGILIILWSFCVGLNALCVEYEIFKFISRVHGKVASYEISYSLINFFDQDLDDCCLVVQESLSTTIGKLNNLFEITWPLLSRYASLVRSVCRSICFFVALFFSLRKSLGGTWRFRWTNWCVHILYSYPTGHSIRVFANRVFCSFIH